MARFAPPPQTNNNKLGRVAVLVTTSMESPAGHSRLEEHPTPYLKNGELR